MNTGATAWTWLLSVTILALAAAWVLSRYSRFGMSPGILVVVWYAVLFGLLPPFLASDPNKWNPRFQLPREAVADPAVQVVALIGLLTLLLVLSIGKSKPRANPGTMVDRDGDLLFMKCLTVAGLLGYAAFLAISGGPTAVLHNISELRSSSEGSSLRILAAFFALSRQYLLFGAMYFSIRAHMSTTASKGWRRWLLWLVVLAAAFLSGGRLGLINVFIAGGLAVVFGRGKIPMSRLVPSALVAFVVAVYGKSVLFQLTNPGYTYQDANRVLARTQSEGQFTALARDFSHPYLSLAQAMYRDYPYRHFNDYWYWAVKPFKLLGYSVPDSISYFNTYLTHGVFDSEIPPGILAFGYLSLGVVGVVIHVAVVGAIVRGLELRVGVARSPFGAAMLAYACILMPVLIFTSDPALFLQSAFPMLVPLLWLLRRPRTRSSRPADELGRPLTPHGKPSSLVRR